MSNNIFINIPYAGTCIKAATVLEAGFDDTKVRRIDCLGIPYTSWVFGSSSNGFDNFEIGKQYLFNNPLQNMDVSEWFSPPFPASAGNGIIAEDGTPFAPE